MTKEEIHNALEECHGVLTNQYSGHNLARAFMRQLQAMEARLYGPAEGYERVWIEVTHANDACVFTGPPTGYENERRCVVVADIPKRVVPVVEGKCV